MIGPAAVELTPVRPEATIEALRAKGLAPSLGWRDLTPEMHARAFAVAGVVQLDILADIRAAVDASVSQGETVARARARIREALTAKGWWRALEIDDGEGGTRTVDLTAPHRVATIVRTNTAVAHSVGRWRHIRRVAGRRPFLRYVTMDDPRVREDHARWHGLVLRWDDPAWERLYPPNGFNCRCRIQQLSERDLRRRGLTVSDSPVFRTARRTDRVTGETRVETIGVDPGWDHHPGLVAEAAGAGEATRDPAARRLVEALDRAPPAVAVAAVRSIVRSPEFADLVGQRHRLGLPVARVPDRVAEALGSESRILVLSRETVDTHTKHGVAAETYALIQDALASADAFLDQRGHVLAWVTLHTRLYRLVFKRTEADELLVTTAHPSEPRHRNRAARRHRRVM